MSELTPNTTHLSEMRWAEHCDCGDDFGGCKYLCVGEGGCCCEITWEYIGEPPFPSLVPVYCKVWDAVTTPCAIACSHWGGQMGQFCPSKFDVEPDPPLRPTYICVPYGTFMSFWNPSTSHIMEVTFQCFGQSSSHGPTTFKLNPRETITLDFDGCNFTVHCQIQ